MKKGIDMSKNELKKMMVFSNHEILSVVMECAEEESKKRDISRSKVIEEYVLIGIARTHPEYREQISSIYAERYLKYIDSALLTQSET